MKSRTESKLRKTLPFLLWIFLMLIWVAWFSFSNKDGKILYFPVLFAPVFILFSTIGAIFLSAWLQRPRPLNRDAKGALPDIESSEISADSFEPSSSTSVLANDSIIESWANHFAEVISAISDVTQREAKIWSLPSGKKMHLVTCYAFVPEAGTLIKTNQSVTQIGKDLKEIITSDIESFLHFQPAERFLPLDKEAERLGGPLDPFEQWSEAGRMHDVLIRLEKKVYGKLNHEPLDWDDITKLCERENIVLKKDFDFHVGRVHSLLLVGTTDEADPSAKNRGGLILLDKDLPALVKRFLALHELGHWYCHSIPDYRCSADKRIYFGKWGEPRVRSTIPSRLIEREANLFALISLIPTKVLNWWDTTGEKDVNEENTHKYVLDTMLPDEKADAQKLEDIIREYCKVRLVNYFRFKDKHLDLRLNELVPNGPIDEKEAEKRKTYFGHRSWIWIDQNRSIVGLNEGYARILRDGAVPLGDFKGKKLDIYTHPEMMADLEKQWAMRKQGKRGYYAFRYEKEDYTSAWIVTWPIFEGDEFRGSFAVEVVDAPPCDEDLNITPRRHRPPEQLPALPPIV
jgi:hypothetical protein